MEGIQIRKGKVKWPLFTHHMIIYGENPKASTIKLLAPISELSKVTVCKIDIKNQLYFYTPAVKNWNINFKKYHLQ